MKSILKTALVFVLFEAYSTNALQFGIPFENFYNECPCLMAHSAPIKTVTANSLNLCYLACMTASDCYAFSYCVSNQFVTIIIHENIKAVKIFCVAGFSSLRGQTVHRINAQFCVCMALDSRDKPLNMFQKVSGIHFQNFRGFLAQTLVT